MVWRKSVGGIVVLAALLVSACASSTPTGQQSTGTPAASVGHFAKNACPFKVDSSLVEGKDVTCGTLTVPEDRQKPQGNIEQLAVATYKNPSATSPDPVIYLQGGPGGGAVYDFAPIINANDRSIFLGHHDLILIDQRGTGYSKPSLQCSETNALQFQTDVNLTAQQSIDLNDKALATCHDRLVSQHINLSAYSTYNSANDIHDLIQAMGYQTVNLWGISYGTRLAQEVMRSFPQHIRSVVLDSTVPPTMINLTSVPRTMAHDLNLMYTTCAAEPTCNAKYPNLQAEFESLLAKLNTNPITFSATDQDQDAADPNIGKSFNVLFHGSDLLNLVFEVFYQTFLIPTLPQLIDQVNNGNYTDLLAKYDGQINFNTALSIGLYYSIRCSEETEFTTADAVAQASQVYPTPVRSDETLYQQADIAICQNWGVPKAPAVQRQPVTSSIPTLILQGEFDPITPSPNGETIAKTLSASYFFQFPGTGHGVFASEKTLCGDKIRVAFQDTPQQKPSSTCIAALGEPQFT